MFDAFLVPLTEDSQPLRKKACANSRSRLKICEAAGSFIRASVGRRRRKSQISTLQYWFVTESDKPNANCNTLLYPASIYLAGGGLAFETSIRFFNAPSSRTATDA
jgi:hypothetical protein